MKALMITGEYPPMSGGIAGYTDILRRSLERIGVETLVLSDQRSEADFTVDAWTWSLRNVVEHLTTAQNFDVVHIQYQAGAFRMHPAVNLLPKGMRGVPVVTTFHDLRPPYLFPKAGRSRNFLMKRMARWSDAVVVTNPADERIIAGSGIRCISIPLGPSIPPPEAVQVGRYAGYFGFPSRQKGFDLLVEAMARIPNSDDRRILVVGSKPPARGNHGFMTEKSVASLAHKHNVSIDWTGYLDPQAASNALASCAVIAFPFPGGATLRSSALIAALQTGRPVLTTAPRFTCDLEDLESMPQLIVTARNDVRGLTESLELLLSSGTGTRDTAPLPDAFQWPNIATRHMETYASIVGRAGR